MKRLGVQAPLLAAVLIGLIVFLYQMADVIGKIQSWAVIWDPPTVSQMLIAVCAGLGAVLAGCGVDVSVLAKPLLQLVGLQGGVSSKPSDQP